MIVSCNNLYDRFVLAPDVLNIILQMFGKILRYSGIKQSVMEAFLLSSIHRYSFATDFLVEHIP